MEVLMQMLVLQEERSSSTHTVDGLLMEEVLSQERIQPKLIDQLPITLDMLQSLLSIINLQIEFSFK